ncbi:MAG: stage II sporulation protein M [Anaeromicrobium sp.]|jgi:uncharacterized membrane protein SpoIIM required for sporulation|uniref:stage II sporulation protein M n=1 Tax=Anaeromicrobium sp. TaxID=1929132 RepID=UPI0025D79F02|nr:stage II sporulation protein M [Anaeromicrobium sp.]MCT4593273.1 stage II sporulation protein M [Anaeromicrobium sp.]
MNEEIFIKNNKSNWDKLNSYVARIDKSGHKNLNSNELRDFLYLYNESAYHLSYANTHFPNSTTSNYLNSLVGRAHNTLYSVKENTFKRMFNYLTKGFPKRIREFSFFINISTAIFFLGFLLSLVMVLINESNAYYFLPKDLVETIDYSMESKRQWDYALMSSYIMVNNISISLKAFVFGITFGIGTIYVLFSNGALLGGLTALIYLNGNPTVYWSLILPHGILELSAIFISGGAGFILAYHMLIPKDLSRAHSIILGAKKASSLLFGIVVMLIIAGIIEGFFTPLGLSPSIKLAFSFMTLIILIFYILRGNK